MADKPVWNYKLKHKNPTKKQERDFIELLKQRGTEVSYKKLHGELYGNYEKKIIYFTLWERILIWLSRPFRRLLKEDNVSEWMKNKW